MKKWICLILVTTLLWGCTAEKPSETTQSPTIPAFTEDTNPPETTQTPIITTFAEVENPVNFFTISMGENDKNILRMDVFYNEDGSVYLEYVGEEKKVGKFDANVMHGITKAFLECGLTALHGQDVYDEGEAIASMYVTMADGTMFAVGYSGQIPQAFQAGYEKMNQFFADLTSALPVYVPQPMVLGEVEAALLKPAMDILNHSGMEALDAYTISQVPKDESFAFAVGLSGDEGIAGAVSCAPMMITDAYSLVIVKLDGAKAEDVCADFEKNLNWRKWVCVAPSHAMIAVKDDMVLCLMGSDRAFNATAAGIRKTGWTEIKKLERP